MIEAEDPDAREWHTLQALERGARVVAGGRLPIDHEGHRVGEPDLLVRHGDGYLPIDVKSHKSLERAKKEGEGTALVSELGAPFLDAAVTDIEHTPRKHVGDLLQLAHYRVLLEAAGFASPSAPWPASAAPRASSSGTTSTRLGWIRPSTSSARRPGR